MKIRTNDSYCLPICSAVRFACLGGRVTPCSEASFRVCCSVIRAIVVMVEMEFDEQIGSIRHGLVDGGVLPRVAQRPKSRSICWQSLIIENGFLLVPDGGG